MSQNYLLSDTIARINNAQLVRSVSVVVYHSKLIMGVLQLLMKSGYVKEIEKFQEREGVHSVRIYLKYEGKDKNPVIKEFKVVSKPGRRVFTPYKKIKKLYGGLGTVILSTSKGIMTDADVRSLKVGGEVLCNIF